MTRAVDPWEQQPGEPPAAFARFVLYRDLGPLRSLREAYAIHLSSEAQPAKIKAPATPASPTTATATPAPASAPVPGSWKKYSSEWRWVERASAYDVAMISTHGRRAMVQFVNVIERLAAKALAGVTNLKPANWDQVLETVQLLSLLIPADALAKLFAERATPPPPPAPAPAPAAEDLRSLMTPEELKHLEALEARARARKDQQATRERLPAPKPVTPQAKEQPPQKQHEPEPDYLLGLKDKVKP